MKQKVMFALCLLMGLMLINSGVNKFTGHMPMPEMAQSATDLIGAFMASGWMWTLIALVEIIGGILFILPKTRALGAVILTPIVVGIALIHFVNAPDMVGIIVACIMLAILLWVISENKDKYMHMIEN